MVTKDYCTYEVSKLLKEKGFRELCWGYYKSDKTQFFKDEEETYFVEMDKYDNSHKEYIACPTHQMAMKWLREKGIIITLNYALNYDSKTAVYWGEITDVSNVTNGRKSTLTCNTYEQAVEAALKYALENLI